MTDTNNLINPHTHIRGEKEVTVKRKAGRPKGSVANKQTREAMKRQFSRVITPKKFALMVEKVYEQGMEGDKASQRLVFENGMIKPGMEGDSQSRDYGVQIVINSMEGPKEIEGEVIDADT